MYIHGHTDARTHARTHTHTHTVIGPGGGVVDGGATAAVVAMRAGKLFADVVVYACMSGKVDSGSAGGSAREEATMLADT